MKKNMPNNCLVKISPEFFESFSELPKSIQRKVVFFFEKFTETPNLYSLNIEKLENKINGKDIYSVKIDREYRTIFYMDKNNSIIHLLWVEIHDLAYEKKDRKNKITVSEKNAELESIKYYKKHNLIRNRQKYLFDRVTGNELYALGVPLKDVAFIKTIVDYNSFQLIKDTLPNDVYSNLEFLVLGFKVQDIIEEEENKREEILNYLNEKILYPPIADDSKLDEDSKESLKNTIIRLEQKKSVKEIIDFYYDALLAKRGKQMCEALHKAGFKAFEDIKDEIKIKFAYIKRD